MDATAADAQTLQRRMTEEWPAAALAADIDRYLSFLTDDFVVLMPDLPAFTSKPELAQWLQDAFDAATFDFSFDVEEVVVIGDWAFARYLVTVTVYPKDGSPTTQIDRKYMDIWQRQADGRWLCHRHMWNNQRPPFEVG